MLYADYNATTPIHPEVLGAMEPYLREEFFNSASRAGIRSKQAIERARQQVAALIDCESDEVVFVSGGTESCFLAILGAVISSQNLPPRYSPPKLVSSPVEHSAVLEAVSFVAENLDVSHDMLKVDRDGILDLNISEKSPAIYSVALANNETGVISPVSELVANLRDTAIVFHCDAVQAVGKIPMSFKSLGVDLLSISGHKFGAPKGVGALIVRSGSNWRSPMRGGGQQSGRRGGTEATALIVGLGKAAEIAKNREQFNSELRDTFEELILDELTGVQINGRQSIRLPNTTNLSIDGISSHRLVEVLVERDIHISSGSACNTKTLEPSHVLKAMGRTTVECLNAIRVSFGPGNSKADVSRLVSEIYNSVRMLREESEEKLGKLSTP